MLLRYHKIKQIKQVAALDVIKSGKLGNESDEL